MKRLAPERPRTRVPRCPHLATRPLLWMIRSLSTGSSGLWSQVRSIASYSPDCVLRPRTARESPTQAVVSWLPCGARVGAGGQPVVVRGWVARALAGGRGQ
jgi:hypothetical protein